MRARWFTAAAAAMAIGSAGAADSDLDRDVRGVMTRYLRFGSTELADLERGRVVRHSMESASAGEIAVAGAVRISAPKERLLARTRDIVEFKRGPEILQIGRFSDPPTIQDLSGLTVDEGDFDPQSCRVGNCDTRLPAAAIERIERELDPKGGNLQQRASGFFKQLLLDHVRAYLSGGAGRITQYDDDQVPVRPVDEFNAILANMPALGAIAPGLPPHLQDFPEHPLASADDFLYWSKEKFAVSAFISVTHVSIVCVRPRTCVIATKDVYSSRFIDASLSITIASDSTASPDAFYLVYTNRSRASGLKGRFSALRRSIAERRARASLDSNLQALARSLTRQ